MLRTWLRRWLDVAPVKTSEDPPWEVRFQELEERVDWLYHSLRKLRGRVTGGLRETGTDAIEPDVKPDRDTELNEQIYRRRRGVSTRTDSH